MCLEGQSVDQVFWLASLSSFAFAPGHAAGGSIQTLSPQTLNGLGEIDMVSTETLSVHVLSLLYA